MMSEQPHTVALNSFERELQDLIKKHGVQRCIVAFCDVDRAPNAVTRMILPTSGRKWCQVAAMALGDKIVYLTATGELRDEDDLPPSAMVPG